MSEGYHAIRMSNNDPLRLWAFNTEGSEVLLTISTETGEIISTEYAYATAGNIRLPIPGIHARPIDPSSNHSI